MNIMEVVKEENVGRRYKVYDKSTIIDNFFIGIYTVCRVGRFKNSLELENIWGDRLSHSYYLGNLLKLYFEEVEK